MLGIKNKTVDVLPIVLFIIAAIIWRTRFYVLCLYTLLPIVIVYSFRKYKSEIFYSKYWKPYLFLLIWMFLSSLLSDNSLASLKIMISVTATFFLSFSVLALSQRGKNSFFLSFAFICLFIAILYSTLTSESYINSFDYANEAERRANTDLNSNQYAYFSLFTIMAVRLMLGRISIYKPLLGLFIYLILAGLSFFVALLTASRQVLLLEIPLIIYFVIFDFSTKENKTNRVFLFLFIFVAAFFFLPKITSLYDSSYLAVRSGEDIEEDARSYLLLMGLHQGLDNPMFGLGFGANVLFSHCTYTHLLARCGAPAFITYIYMVYISIKEQYQRYKTTHDKYFRLYFFMLVFFAVANFFYSYINQPFMQTIMFLIIGESDKLYSKYRKLFL